MTQERQRLVAWEKTARGKGLRWRILRDVVACLRLHWMTFEELAHVMMRLRGLTCGLASFVGTLTSEEGL